MVIVYAGPEIKEAERKLHKHALLFFFWRNSGITISCDLVKEWINATIGIKTEAILLCRDQGNGFFLVYFDRKRSRDLVLPTTARPIGIAVKACSFPWCAATVNDKGEECWPRMLELPGLPDVWLMLLDVIGNALGTYIGVLDPDTPRIAVMLPVSRRLPFHVKLEVRKGVFVRQPVVEFREDCFDQGFDEDDGYLAEHEDHHHDQPRHPNPQDGRDHQSGGASTSSSELIPGLGHQEAMLCLARLPRSERLVFYTVSKAFYQLVRSGELESWRRSVGVVMERHCFVCLTTPGGGCCWKGVCLDTGKWWPLPPRAQDGDELFGSVMTGTQLLVLGRHSLWTYCLRSDKWLAPATPPAYECAFGSSEHTAFVAGGIDEQGFASTAAAVYTSTTSSWKFLPDTNKARRSCSGVCMDGKFYVLGGVSQTGLPMYCGEEFDPALKIWTVIDNMVPWSEHHMRPLVTVLDNELFGLNTRTKSLVIYCKRSNTWKAISRARSYAELQYRARGESNSWDVVGNAAGNTLLTSINGSLIIINGRTMHAWEPPEDVLQPLLEGGSDQEDEEETLPIRWATMEIPGGLCKLCAVMAE